MNAGRHRYGSDNNFGGRIETPGVSVGRYTMASVILRAALANVVDEQTVTLPLGYDSSDRQPF